MKNYENIQKKVDSRAKRREQKKKTKMKVSGKSVQKLKKLIVQKRP